jgi:hypothetical protein
MIAFTRSVGFRVLPVSTRSTRFVPGSLQGLATAVEAGGFRTVFLIVLLGSLASFAMLAHWAPSYLTRLGFPLDDAWIHAVYGRALARSGSLAYNPGFPATGSTAPLWSLLMALPHLVAADAGSAVLLTKLVGFLLHATTAVLIGRALYVGSDRLLPSLGGALLVALHPDLVAASVSGMEVPLATAFAAGLLLGVQRLGPGAYAALCLVAFLSRPELAVVGVLLPLGLAVSDRRRSVRLLVAALAGIAAALAVWAGRNLAVSGRPLPATFYAKVGDGPGLVAALRLGFAGLLARVPILDSSLVLFAAVLVSIWSLVVRPGGEARADGAAAAFLTGLSFCVVSFFLIAPADPGAFYHQRYVLPVVPLLIAPIPVLADAVLQRYAARGLGMALFALLLATLFLDAPVRYGRLTNDARNIDDVQVALGRSLASASPSDVVWAVDAGAIRYFGNAFVVDMIGLNTPEMLGARSPEFLQRHPPRYLELVPGWSALDERSGREARGVLYEPTTPYTVTGYPIMQRHFLVDCALRPISGRFAIFRRVFGFDCAPAATASPSEPESGRRS